MTRFSPCGTYAPTNSRNDQGNFKMRIMIVEDDRDVRESLGLFLTEFLNAEVLTFSEPGCAIAAINVFKPQVAIVDFGLQRMNGIELTKKIKEISPYCYVAMISATDSVSLAVEAMRAGCQNFVKKPFHIDAIAACVKEATFMANHVKSLDEIESEHIENVVATSATLEKAAEKLGMSGTTLWRKRKKESKAS